MKIQILSLIVAGLFFFTSCQTEEIDPVFEIYVTTKASENWTNTDFDVAYVRVANLTDSGEQGWAGITPFTTSSYNLDLSQENTVMVHNDRHFDLEMLGLKLDLWNVNLANQDFVTGKVTVPYFKYGELDESISIKNGKTYRIDFTIDFDEQIYEENGTYFLDPNYEIEVIEL